MNPTTSPVEFMNMITGRIIYGGEVTEDGMHIELNDGRVIVVTGSFVVGLAQLEKESIQ